MAGKSTAIGTGVMASAVRALGTGPPDELMEQRFGITPMAVAAAV